MDDIAEIIRPPEAAALTVKEAWAGYLSVLEEMRLALEASDQFKRWPQHRGMAYRQMMEVQAMAYNFTVAPRTAHPRIFRNTGWQTEFYSIGGNGGDFDYRLTYVEGAHTYRMTGRVNDTRMLVVQVNSATPGMPDSRCLANYDFSDFELGPDGSFDVIVSATPHEGNWIELLPDADYQWMMFRPLIEKWEHVPAEIQIERISPLDEEASRPDEYSEKAVARRIKLATSFVRFVITDWAIGYVPMVLNTAGVTNKFVGLADDGGQLGSPVAQYLQCVWEVEDDEALILEFDEEPPTTYWSLQVYDVWQHGMDFRTCQTMLNGGQLHQNADGGFRVVLSRQDPGIANWLSSGGYTSGEVTWRLYKCTKNVGHRIHRVKFNRLDDSLPADMKRVSPEERARELETRRATYLRRHGE